ncbi:MAG: hypothetical protein KKA73_01590, partial [Chloroflexi bacterium]|nr:hypothetical protein [Chloroflexota bacterium]
MNDRKKHWPCIGEAGLQVFTTTADQRFLLGRETFLCTHFPITMRTFQAGELTSTRDESWLLDELLNGRSAMGNRIFLLYG